MGEREVKRQRFVTTGEAADLLSVSPKTIARYVDAGRLPAIRTLGGHRRISRAAIETLLIELAQRG